jgi:uncharacterized SAM-binding protein YcdF (DUF218 family)
MVIGVVWLAWRRQWRSALWLGIPTTLIWLVGSTPLAAALVEREERRCQGPREHGLSSDGHLDPKIEQPDVVVMLSSGYYASDRDLYGFALSDAGSRILTALELARLGKVKALVLGGSVPISGRPGAVAPALLEDWVRSWALVSAAVTNLGICMDTHDEATRFRKLKDDCGWKKVILVTSALHIRRSEALFRKQGIEVVPVACDFQVHGVPDYLGFRPFPQWQGFKLLSLYLHEKIGWWVYRARGWI